MACFILFLCKLFLFSSKWKLNLYFNYLCCPSFLLTLHLSSASMSMDEQEAEK